MSEPVWPEGYWRDARWVGGWLAAVLLVVFSPFLLGNRTLLTSAMDAPSLFPAGALAAAVPGGPYKEPDPGAAAWFSEPALQIEHDALFRDHRLPWWDPYDGYGAPFAAAQQTQPFTPLTLLASVHPSPRTWNWYIVARFFVAGFFGALFVRLYGGRAAALAAAIACSLSGYYILFFSMPHLSVEMLLPALLWATEWAVRRPGLASAAALAAVTGTMHLGGMPESAAIGVTFASLYLAARTILSRRPRVTLARVATFAAGNVMGAAIGGVMLIPLLEYFSQGFDTHRRAVGGGLIPGLAGEQVPAWRALFLRLVPLGYGPPLNAITDPAGGLAWAGVRGWFGTSAAFGALVAVFAAIRLRRERSALAGPIAALAVVTVCAVGKSLGAGWINWIGALPGLRLALFLKYGEPFIDVCVALLFGFGVAVFERGRRPEWWVPPAAAAAVLTVITAGFAGALRDVPPSLRQPFLFAATSLAVTVLGVAFVATMLQRPRARVALLVAAVAIDAVANYYAPMYGFITTIPTDARNPYAGADYIRTLHALDHDALRVLGKDGPLWPNWSGAMRLDNPTSLNALYPRAYLPFVGAFLKPAVAGEDLSDRVTLQSQPSLTTAPARRWMTLSSIAFIVVPVTERLDDPHLRVVREEEGLRIYAYDDPLPRASVFHDVRIAATADDALGMLTGAAIDPKRTLVLTAPGPMAAPPPAGGSVARDAARIVARDGSNVAIEAELARPGYVMLNDLNYPGWTASVDGRAAPVLEADYLFRAVSVDTGRHVVRFAYRSRAVALGEVLTVLGLIAALACALAARRRPRQERVVP